MDRGFRRTFVTVGEAVAILIKWVDGPVVFAALDEYPSQEDQELLDGIEFCLQEELEEEKASLASDWAEAKFDKLPSSVIEAKRKAVQRHALVMAHAKTYLCAIEAELDKADPMLKEYKKISSSGGTCITLSSLSEWAVKKGYGVQVLTPVPMAASPKVESAEEKKGAPKPRRRQREQEEAIVAEIQGLGYEPLQLPKKPPGKGGIKETVRDVLATTPLFIGTTVFDKAWERLQKDRTLGTAK